MNSYTKLLNKHKGENAFILGAGPSLYFNKLNPIFENIKKYGKTISVNSSILANPEPDYWISCDHLCVRWSWFSLVKKMKGIKIVRDSWIKYKEDTKGFYFFSPRKTTEDQIDFRDEGLCYCNSTNSAIDFAIKSGFSNIFILGLDHKRVNDKDHFWQFFSKKNQPNQIRPAQGKWDQQKSVFPIHIQSYKALRRFAEYKNCKVYNCNIDSEVEVFEKIEFKNILEIIKR